MRFKETALFAYLDEYTKSMIERWIIATPLTATVESVMLQISKEAEERRGLL